MFFNKSLIIFITRLLSTLAYKVFNISPNGVKIGFNLFFINKSSTIFPSAEGGVVGLGLKE